MNSASREYVFNMQGVDLFVIRNFLNEEECDYICNLIKTNNQRSTVVGKGDEIKVYDEGRTSKSSFLSSEDDMVNKVDQKIADELNVPLSHSEPMQGQLYEEGEYFNDHLDYFDEVTYKKSCLSSGQRTWTSMIYLNHVEEGGNTEFPIIGKSFAPEKGTALFWLNSTGKGFENSSTLHSGRPVIRGEKMIITKWFRENVYDPVKDQELSLGYIENVADPDEKYNSDGVRIIKSKDGEIVEVNIEYVDGIAHARYEHSQDIPALTHEGFKKVPIPSGLYQKILAFYNKGRVNASPEFDPKEKGTHLSNYIMSNESDFPTEMIQLSDQMKQVIFDDVEKVLIDWTGRKLAPTYCYGIRTYNRGAVLKKHIDGFETRIVSAILNVDQQVDEDWALQIDDHDGNEHEVFLKPGEMALYESATLRHGRVKPFNGDYFSNLFVHFVNLT